jgi:hypothetical protein
MDSRLVIGAEPTTHQRTAGRFQLARPCDLVSDGEGPVFQHQSHSVEHFIHVMTGHTWK